MKLKRTIIGAATAAALAAGALAYAPPAIPWDDKPCGDTEQTAHKCAPGEKARDGSTPVPLPVTQTPTQPTPAPTPTPPEVVPPEVPAVVPPVVRAREVKFTFGKYGPKRIHAGHVATYRFTFTNLSTRTTLRQVQLVDPLRHGFAVVSLPTGATLHNGRVDWSFVIVPPGVTRVRFMRLRVLNVQGPLCNLGSASTEGTTKYSRTCAKVVRPVPRSGGIGG